MDFGEGMSGKGPGSGIWVLGKGEILVNHRIHGTHRRNTVLQETPREGRGGWDLNSVSFYLSDLGEMSVVRFLCVPCVLWLHLGLVDGLFQIRGERGAERGEVLHGLQRDELVR